MRKAALIFKAYFSIRFGKVWYVRTPVCGFGKLIWEFGQSTNCVHSWFSVVPRIPLKEGEQMYRFNWIW